MINLLGLFFLIKNVYVCMCIIHWVACRFLKFQKHWWKLRICFPTGWLRGINFSPFLEWNDLELWDRYFQCGCKQYSVTRCEVSWEFILISDSQCFTSIRKKVNIRIFITINLWILFKSKHRSHLKRKICVLRIIETLLAITLRR